jgi:hypothetical protein
VGGLDQRLGLGPGVPEFLHALLAEPLRLLLRAVAGLFRLRALLLGLAADLLEFCLAGRAPLLVRLVALGAPLGDLRLDLLAHLVRALPGVGERLLALGLAAGRPLVAAGHDLRRLLLGEGEDLVDHRPQVAERRAVDLHGRVLPQFGHLGLKLLQLRGHGLHLSPGALALGTQRRQFRVMARHELVDLALVVAPHHEVELRPITAA